MTFDAWRSAVGGAWQRALLYPGGLALALALLAAWAARHMLWRRPQAGLPPPNIGAGAADILGFAAAWLAIALLPVPAVAPPRQPIDLPTAWALLELPLLAALFGNLANVANPQRGSHLITGWLVGLPLLALLLALTGSVAGALTLGDLPKLGRAPWLGGLAALLWLAALVPFLGLGPWSSTPSGAPRRLSAGQLLLDARRIGHLLLFSHFIAAANPPPPADGLAGMLADQRVVFAQTFLTAGLVLALIHRIGQGRSPVAPGRAVWALGVLGCIALAWHSVAPLQP